MQVEVGVLGLGQGPLPLLAPHVVAHDEQVDGGLPVHAVVHALQIVIEPAELQRPVVDAGLRTEVAVHVVDALVGPRVHDHSLKGWVRQGVHSGEVPHVAPCVVVPAGDAQDWNLDSTQACLDGEFAPIGVERWVIEPVVPKLRPRAPCVLGCVDDRQMIECLHQGHVAHVREGLLHGRVAEPRHDGGREDHVDVGHQARGVSGGHHRRDGGEVRRRRDGGVPRIQPGVRAADHAYLAVAPGQR